MDNIEKAREYRARTCNFAGFALMTPFGHLIIDPASLLKVFDLFGLSIYFIVCVMLFILGLYFIEIGRDILYNKR